MAAVDIAMRRRMIARLMQDRAPQLARTGTTRVGNKHTALPCDPATRVRSMRAAIDRLVSYVLVNAFVTVEEPMR